MATQLRRVFQIDGQNGGVLNIAERPNDQRVLLIVSNGDAEAQISISREDWIEMCGLRYELRFGVAEPQEPAALRVVV